MNRARIADKVCRDALGMPALSREIEFAPQRLVELPHHLPPVKMTQFGIAGFDGFSQSRHPAQIGIDNGLDPWSTDLTTTSPASAKRARCTWAMELRRERFRTECRNTSSGGAPRSSVSCL